MTARMPSPARTFPTLGKGVGLLLQAVHGGGVPDTTLELVHLRVSQMNGCAFCVDMAATALRKAGETDERLALVAVWREAPGFTDAERAALALAEASTLNAPGGVPDAVWDDAADEYDETALGAIVTQIALTTFFNRINVAVRQPVGAW
ncbi:alkyl hydroperoxide reductase AhpD [Actinomycetospora sp. NBRC 106375]|uniref:carboxymuconolactone decarboxylase family protein n=1 Tax=Actinomycetospora sp. NBRC 106375 TaxID=3032207 RepID=UPI0024A25469|nr:carboxymuconolactone decarboxylase family protein [Actinomycetospora sp. NBRC 106375]GLZ45657.1 alkyl hydroperoxide reductase AhpD [Actinomycetospora sp. NBRC 106375]